MPFKPRFYLLFKFHIISRHQRRTTSQRMNVTRNNPQHTPETRQLRQTTSLRSHPMKKKMNRRTLGRRSVVDRGQDDARILFTMWEKEYRARNKTTTNVFNQMYSLKQM
jgi:hypothetical protein